MPHRHALSFQRVVHWPLSANMIWISLPARGLARQVAFYFLSAWSLTTPSMRSGRHDSVPGPSTVAGAVSVAIQQALTGVYRCCRSLLAARLATGRNPKRIDPTVVRGGGARRGHNTVHRGQEPQIGDEGPEVFFIPVRGLIPDHALPVQHPPLATEATAAGAGHVCVAPGPNTRLLVRGNIAH